MEFNDIVKILKEKFAEKISLKEDKEVVFVEADIWEDLSKELNNNADLAFDYLMCISSYDMGDDKTYGVAYNFYSNIKKHYLELRIEVEDGVSIPSVVALWKTADWHEREAFDMMGIHFENHPNLKRILLADDWEGHPLRKKYVEPNYYHGLPVPKDKSYWE